MSLILHIDTAGVEGAVSIGLNGKALAQRISSQQKDHAAWIHVAIEAIMQEAGYTLNDLNAVAVVAGPGSYTGLRVGMATAKGFCYVLKVPLITLNTLAVMAYAAAEAVSNQQVAGIAPGTDPLLCPMIDARRMEVFTALFDLALQDIVNPAALVLDSESFNNWLDKKNIIFFGNGSDKWKLLVNHVNAHFADIYYQPGHVIKMSQQQFDEGLFTDVAYCEPIYLKDFYTHQKK